MTSSPHAADGRFITLDGITPRVADGAFIAGTAVLIGDVTVAAGASIWFGAVLRADLGPIRIGANSNIQDGCVLHTDPGYELIIGENVTVGHRAIVHGAIVGDGALVGMGAVLLNGCQIGAGALIAAGAVVREGAQIPPGMLAGGVPARVLREVDEETAAGLRLGGPAYVELAGRYLP